MKKKRMCIERVKSELPNSDGLCLEFISSEITEVPSQLKIILKTSVVPG